MKNESTKLKEEEELKEIKKTLRKMKFRKAGIDRISARSVEICREKAMDEVGL